MRPDPVAEFCLGLGALLIALTIALLLAFPPAWMDQRRTASAVFADVTHLSEGANVTEDGIVEGNVISIERVNDGVRVRMKVLPDWHLRAGLGLTIEQVNPLQAGSLMVATACKRAPGEKLKAGCCPDKLFTGSAEPGDTALASCGHTPGLVDKAMEIANEAVVISDLATTQLNSLKNLTSGVPVILDKTQTAISSIETVTGKVSGVLDDNRASLTGIIANANGTIGHVNNVTGKFDDLMTAKREQLDTSITSLSNMMATTAAAMPGIVADLQKTAEDMRAITGQVRSEPTSVIRKRERVDPAFVEPAQTRKAADPSTVEPAAEK